MTDRPTYKRRIRLIQPTLQLRLIGAFAAMTALALVLQALVLADSLTRQAGEMGSSGAELASAMPEILGRSLAICAVLVLPALVLIGVRITFRIAGPLYRMERHLEAVARGEQTGPCRIRDEDHLHGFCDTLNRALAVATGAVAPEAEQSDESSPEPKNVAA